MRTKLAFKQLKFNVVEFAEAAAADGQIEIKALGIARGKIADKAVSLGKMADFTGNDKLLVGDPTAAGAVIEGQIEPRHLSTNLSHAVYTAITGIGTQNQPLNMGGASKITSLADGTAADDACTVSQMEAHVSSTQLGLYWKNSVARASDSADGTNADGDIALSNILEAIDGATPSADDRILLQHQADPGFNGIWIAKVGSWERATDFDNTGDFLSSAACWVREGTKNGDKAFTQTQEISAITAPAGNANDTDQVWVQFSGLGQIEFPANAGLEKPGGIAGQIGIAARGVLSGMVASNRALLAPLAGMTANMAAGGQVELAGGSEETLDYDDGMIASSAAVYLNGVLLRRDTDVLLPNGDYHLQKKVNPSTKVELKIQSLLTSVEDKVEIRWISAV